MPHSILADTDLVPPPGFRERAWREWCFVKAVLRERWQSGLLLAVLLFGGGLLWVRLEPVPHHGYFEGIYFTWSLIFAQAPEALPASWILRSMYFVVPALGLGVLLEAIIAVSRMIGDRQTYEQSWCRIMAGSMSDHVILVGLGRLGYRTFRLLRRMGERVAVIEANPRNQFLEDVRQDGSPLLIGDARRESLLETAGITDARSVIACTTDDLANLEIVLDARRLRPGIRVICRMFDQNMADKVRDGFNIHYAMSQAMISAPAFALAAANRSIVNTTTVGEELVITVRWTVGPRLAGRTVAHLMDQHHVGILERRSAAGAADLFPPPAATLDAGDTILVQGRYESLIRLDPDSV